MPGSRSRVSVVLAGGVAKGAFEAGALEVLAEADVEVARIVATSAGALNASLFAWAVRTRNEIAASSTLTDLWRDEAKFTKVFWPSFHAIFHGEGFSGHDQVLRIMRDHIQPIVVPDPAPIELRLVVAPLAGTVGTIGTRPATTYEQVIDFSGEELDTHEGLERVFAAAVASASFPFAFSPADVPGLGPCIDGGAVNNTPIKWALGARGDGPPTGPPIDLVLVIAPTVELAPPLPADHQLKGLELATHLADMLIGDRLYRDLHEAAQVNRRLRALAALQLDAATDARVRAALDLAGAYPVDIVPIRPLEELPGSAFTGFFDEKTRVGYIQAGRARAETVLRDAGLLR